MNSVHQIVHKQIERLCALTRMRAADRLDLEQEIWLEILVNREELAKRILREAKDRGDELGAFLRILERKVLYRKWQNYRDRKSDLGFIDRLKRKRADDLAGRQSAFGNFASNQEQESARREFVHRMDTALPQLQSRLDQRIVRLRIFCGKTFTEIAHIEGCDRRFVSARYYRALATLRGFLDDFDDYDGSAS